MIPKPTSMTNRPGHQDWESIAKSYQEENKRLTEKLKNLEQANRPEHQKLVSTIPKTTSTTNRPGHQDWESIAKSYQEENKRLTEKLQNLEQANRPEHQKLVSTITKTTSTTNRPGHQDPNWESIAKSYQDENKRLTEQVNDLKWDLNQANEVVQQNIELRNELTSLTNENADLIAELQRKITQLQNEDDARKKALQTACDDLDEIKVALDGEPQLEEDFSKVTNNLRRLTAAVDLDRVDTIGSKPDQDTIKDLREQLARKQRLITELEGCVDQTNRILDECEGTIRDLTDENERLRARNEDLAKYWREKYNDLIKINENLLEELENLETIEKTVEFLTEQFTILLEQIQQMSGVMSALGNNARTAKNKGTKPTEASQAPSKQRDQPGAEVSQRPLTPTEAQAHEATKPKQVSTNLGLTKGPDQSGAELSQRPLTPTRPTQAHKATIPIHVKSDPGLTKERDQSGAELSQRPLTPTRPTQAHKATNSKNVRSNPDLTKERDRSGAEFTQRPLMSNMSVGTQKLSLKFKSKSGNPQSPSIDFSSKQDSTTGPSSARIENPPQKMIEKEVKVIDMDHSFVNADNVYSFEKLKGPVTSKATQSQNLNSQATMFSDVSAGSEDENCICTGMLMCKMKCRKCKIRYKQLVGKKSFDSDAVTLQDACRIPHTTVTTQISENFPIDNNQVLDEIIVMVGKIIEKLKWMSGVDPEVLSVRPDVVQSLVRLEEVLSKQSRHTQASSVQCCCCDCMDVLTEKFCHDECVS